MPMKTLLYLLFAVLLAGSPSAGASGLSGEKPIEISTGRLQYPPEAQLRGMSGFATVVIEVDETGRLLDHLVTESSHPLFARAAEEIVLDATYRPAQVEGRSIPLRTTVPIEFKTGGIVVNSDFQAIVDLYLQGGQMRNQANRLPTLPELDGIPVPIDIAAPPFPVEWARQGFSGSVLIDFYIDDRGRVRMPAIVRASHDELGGLALDTVRQWRFEPPQCRGHAVTVRVRQEFHFKGDVAPAP